jgi:hypothetical protein
LWYHNTTASIALTGTLHTIGTPDATPKLADQKMKYKKDKRMTI